MKNFDATNKERKKSFVLNINIAITYRYLLDFETLFESSVTFN